MTAVWQASVSEFRELHRSDGQNGYELTNISFSASANISLLLGFGLFQWSLKRIIDAGPRHYERQVPMSYRVSKHRSRSWSYPERIGSWTTIVKSHSHGLCTRGLLQKGDNCIHAKILQHKRSANWSQIWSMMAAMGNCTTWVVAERRRCGQVTRGSPDCKRAFVGFADIPGRLRRKSC